MLLALAIGIYPIHSGTKLLENMYYTVRRTYYNTRVHHIHFEFALYYKWQNCQNKISENTFPKPKTITMCTTLDADEREENGINAMQKHFYSIQILFDSFRSIVLHSKGSCCCCYSRHWARAFHVWSKSIPNRNCFKAIEAVERALFVAQLAQNNKFRWHQRVFTFRATRPWPKNWQL